MTKWRDDIRTCDCGERFLPKREAQAYCTKRCANAATQRRKRSGDITEPLTPLPRSGDTAAKPALSPFSGGSTMVWPDRYDPREQTPPGTLEGDDYQLEYYADGYAKLPACLDRRPLTFAEAA